MLVGTWGCTMSSHSPSSSGRGCAAARIAFSTPGLPSASTEATVWPSAPARPRSGSAATSRAALVLPLVPVAASTRGPAKGSSQLR